MTGPAFPAPVQSRPAAARWARWLGWAAAALVLCAVFAAYLQPAMALLLAQQLWSCF